VSSAFRYSGQRYNDSLLALGNVRIGTLHDFRSTEHKGGIADVNEGIKSVSHDIPYFNSRDVGSAHREAIKQFKLIDFDDSDGISLKDIRMIQKFDHPNCFVHCVSSEYSRSVLAQFDGADSCVEIVDLFNFYRRLTETLNLHVPVVLLGIAEVRYMPRDEEWNGLNWGGHPALIKEPSFSKQCEIRAIWQPKFSVEIAPIVINDTALINFCKRKKLP
jgi:hypothetical protein